MRINKRILCELNSFRMLDLKVGICGIRQFSLKHNIETFCNIHVVIPKNIIRNVLEQCAGQLAMSWVYVCFVVVVAHLPVLQVLVI